MYNLSCALGSSILSSLRRVCSSCFVVLSRPDRLPLPRTPSLTLPFQRPSRTPQSLSSLSPRPAPTPPSPPSISSPSLNHLSPYAYKPPLSPPSLQPTHPTHSLTSLPFSSSPIPPSLSQRISLPSYYASPTTPIALPCSLPHQPSSLALPLPLSLPPFAPFYSISPSLALSHPSISSPCLPLIAPSHITVKHIILPPTPWTTTISKHTRIKPELFHPPLISITHPPDLFAPLYHTKQHKTTPQHPHTSKPQTQSHQYPGTDIPPLNPSSPHPPTKPNLSGPIASLSPTLEPTIPRTTYLTLHSLPQPTHPDLPPCPPTPNTRPYPSLPTTSHPDLPSLLSPTVPPTLTNLKTDHSPSTTPPSLPPPPPPSLPASA
ncbi:hypothetical protein C7M84_024558 [Penaeus vannamei]|uniref:Uncharacterized protein n=1 Tax=Penaeus vannamei TaxID=6689 RepID=A0A3R7MP54_PENVA|nr:hypothetical protein C7M84_024558 [Penaeus vannamei]